MKEDIQKNWKMERKILKGKSKKNWREGKGKKKRGKDSGRRMTWGGSRGPDDEGK